MRRARGGPVGASPDPSRALYGSRSEPGAGQFRNGDLRGYGSDELTSKQNVVTAYSGQRSYAGYAKADFTQSTINLVTCVLGAGALGYPFCFKECGLVLATIIMLVTLVATRISYQLLLHCTQLSMRRTYEGIAESALGKTGRQLLELCIAAMSLGALVAFLDILADVLSAVAGTIIPPGAEPSRHAYITGVTVLGALPVCLLVRDHALIAALSNASVLFVIVFALVVFCTAFAPYVEVALGFRSALAAAPAGTAAAAGATGAAAVAVAGSSAAAAVRPALHLWHAQGVLVALPVMAYGFTAHQYYMGIYTMLRAPSVRKMKLVTDLALLICACVYWTCGVGGYATFGERTAGDIIRNLGGSRSLGLLGAYARALKLCYGMAILGNIPLVIMPFYSILKPLLPLDEQIRQSTVGLASSCTVAGAKNAAAGSFAVRIGSASSTAAAKAPALKSKTSCAGQEALRDDGSGEVRGTGTQQQQQQTVLQPPVWQDDQQQQQQQQQQEGQQQEPQQQHLDPHLAAHQASYVLTGMQHALVVFIVLGLGLASAVWLPNVELIFGLTGSTASVLVAFIIPAVCFIKLYEAAPELGGGGGSSWEDGCSSCGVVGALFQVFCCCCSLGTWLVSLCCGSSGSKGPSSSSSSSSSLAVPSAGLAFRPPQLQHPPNKAQVLVVPELLAQWRCRHRLAVALLVFGIISGLLCTDAILSSISEEKAVVQLAQELVAHEAVVAEASRAQQKAKEAAAAVDAMNSAVEQLGSVSSNANHTLGALAAAAEALNTIASKNGSSGSGEHKVWDLKGRIEEHKAKMAEDGVLKNVEAALSAATADITSTIASVTNVVIKLDASIAQIKADAVAADVMEQHQLHQQEAAAAAAAMAAAAAAVPDGRPKAPDGTVLPEYTAGSSHIIPHGDPSMYRSGSSGSGANSSSNGTAAGPAAAPAADAAPTSGKLAYERANEMARELGKALGSFSQAAGSQGEAGKSLEQVRDSAVAALTALNMTADVLQQVRSAVAAARNSPKRDSNVKELVVLAMQRALNATAASALAMQITGDALSTAATEETSELLNALTQIAHDVEKSRASAGKLKARGRSSITVTSEGSSGTGGTAELVSAGAASGDATSSSGTAAPAAVAGSTGSTSGAGSTTVGQQQQQQPLGQPTLEEAQAAAAAKANAAAHGLTESVAAADNTLPASISGDVAVGQQPQQQQQPPPGQPTLEEAQAAAAAKANAAAHAGAPVLEPVAQGTAGSAHGPATDAAAGSGETAAATAEGTAPAATPAAGGTSDSGPEQGTPLTAEEAAAAKANAAAHADSVMHTAAASDAAAAAAAAAAAPSGAQPAVVLGPVLPQPASGDAAAAAAPAEAATTAAGGSAAEHAAAAATTTGSAVADTTPAQLAAADASSSQSTDTGAAAAAAKKTAAQAASEAATAVAALSTQDTQKIKAVIANIASALSSSSSGSSSSSNATAGGAANVTALAAAIRDAVAWTRDSKAAVTNMIVHELGKSDPKVAERVIGIVQDISITEGEAKSKQAEAEAEAGDLQLKLAEQQQLDQQAAAADKVVAGPVVGAAVPAR